MAYTAVVLDAATNHEDCREVHRDPAGRLWVEVRDTRYPAYDILVAYSDDDGATWATTTVHTYADDYTLLFQGNSSYNSIGRGRLYIDSDGYPVVFACVKEDSPLRGFVDRHTFNGATWSKVEEATSSTANFADFKQIDIEKDVTAFQVKVEHEFLSSAYTLFCRVMSTGTWGSWEQIDTHASQKIAVIGFNVDNDGTIHILHQTPTVGAYHSYKTTGGSWVKKDSITTLPAAYDALLSALVTPAGVPCALVQWGGTGYLDFFHKPLGGSWGGEEVAAFADPNDWIGFGTLSYTRSGKIYLIYTIWDDAYGGGSPGIMMVRECQDFVWGTAPDIPVSPTEEFDAYVQGITTCLPASKAPVNGWVATGYRYLYDGEPDWNFTGTDSGCLYSDNLTFEVVAVSKDQALTNVIGASIEFYKDGNLLDSPVTSALFPVSSEKVRYQKVEIKNSSATTDLMGLVVRASSMLGAITIAAATISDTVADTSGYTFSDQVVFSKIAMGASVYLWARLDMSSLQAAGTDKEVFVVETL